MGTFLNPRTNLFRNSLRSEIYIDKSMLIAQTNKLINTEQRYICVSRPRRFGKSMAANMLSAYYTQGDSTAELFDTLKIHYCDSYAEHLNQYDVLKINMQDFLSSSSDLDEMLTTLSQYLIFDLLEKYTDIRMRNQNSLIQVMNDIYSHTGHPFVILIDEWDCLFREYQDDKDTQKKYLNFLRMWLKDKDYVALAYMTGILPIKKYGSHSALNMFTEYSMTDSGALSDYFGFTESEVMKLCAQYKMCFDEAKSWYNGYKLVTHTANGDIIHSIYSPKSVVESMIRHKFDTYWNQTETYEALKKYIQMDMNGLKQAVVEMLAGNPVKINTKTFSNDMTSFATKDDILTLLIHLGYLTYNSIDETVSIPNKEVAQEYINAISTMDWTEVIRSIDASRQLLNAMWNMDGDSVALGLDHAHDEISILQYNDENSLSCTIHLTFYFAQEYYNMVREYPSGKGFADICLIPRKSHPDKAAAIIELKWNKNAQGAIDQIRNKQYVNAFKDYHGNLLLVGINYDKKTKRHSCKIEKYQITD